MASPLTARSIVQRADSVMCNSVDGDLVMMDVERGSYYGLDAVGTDIWNRLQHPLGVAQLCESLQKVYRVDAETCERDVLKLLEQMRSVGLISVVDAS